MPIIKLKSCDGVVFDVEIEVAKCSGTIKSMLEACDIEDNLNAILPLPNVNSATLRRILMWSEYHKNDPVPKDDDKKDELRTDDILPWDADFLNIDQGKAR